MATHDDLECKLLFVSEFGEKIEVLRFSRRFKGYLKYASLSGFTLHRQCHYAIAQMAKTDVWAASLISGHNDLKVTRQYLHEDPTHVGAAHDLSDSLARLLVNVHSQKQARKN